jgi:hypothetical protein
MGNFGRQQHHPVTFAQVTDHDEIMEPNRVLRPPGAAEIPLAVTTDLATLEVRRRRVLGGLINEHEQAA